MNRTDVADKRAVIFVFVAVNINCFCKFSNAEITYRFWGGLSVGVCSGKRQQSKVAVKINHKVTLWNFAADCPDTVGIVRLIL